jgi:energy-coupling factor transport system ATP-binding protein
MATLLVGPNFSGRSEWLRERRRQNSWPWACYIGPFPERACTGLTSTVSDELTLLGGSYSAQSDNALFGELEIEALFPRDIASLSGGEAVRVAIASAAAQKVVEVQLDTALEQLDAPWRERIFMMLASAGERFAKRTFISDNHFSSRELEAVDEHLDFPFDGWSDRSPSWPPTINPALVERRPRKVDDEIVVKDVTFSYGRRQPSVINCVSLCLRPGTLYLLDGPNGSGKTTFVKLLCGTLRPQFGEIRIGGRLFQPAKSRRRFAALAFQNPDYQWTTGLVRSEFSDRCIEELQLDISLLEAGLPNWIANTNPIELPFAMKKRLSNALVLVDDSPWLIFDEPTLGQDWEYRLSLVSSLERLLELRIGIILISHDSLFKARLPFAEHLRFQNGGIELISQ